MNLKLERKKHEHIVEKINSRIPKVIDAALIDFMMVSSVLKKCKETHVAGNGQEDDAISNLVKKLQFVDAFNQRLTHIQTLNNLLFSKNSGGTVQYHFLSEHPHALFTLNYLQAVVAAHDFMAAVNESKVELHRLHDYIITVTQLDFDETDYFKHTANIATMMDGISESLKYLGDETVAEVKVYAISKEDVTMLNGFYTMESERYIITWLLKHQDANVAQLLQSYDADCFGRQPEEIELF